MYQSEQMRKKWSRWKEEVSFQEVKGDTEGEIDTPCVRFLTCPLPVLVICCHVLDMTLTERWKHHIGILPLHLPTALPPVCLHQCLISSLSSTHIVCHTLLCYFLLHSFCFIHLFFVLTPYTISLHISHLLTSSRFCLLHIIWKFVWILFGPKTPFLSASTLFSPSSLLHFLLVHSSKSHLIICCLNCTFIFDLSLTLIPSFTFEKSFSTTCLVFWTYTIYQMLQLNGWLAK